MLVDKDQLENTLGHISQYQSLLSGCHTRHKQQAAGFSGIIIVLVIASLSPCNSSIHLKKLNNRHSNSGAPDKAF